MGTISGYLSSIKAAVEGATPAGTNAIGSTKDNGPAWTPTRQPGYSADASSTALDVTAAPTSGQKIVMDDCHIGTSTTACIVSLYEESNATAIWTMPFGTNDKFVFVPRDLLKLATANKKLQLKTNPAAPVYTWCSYHSEA